MRISRTVAGVWFSLAAAAAALAQGTSFTVTLVPPIHGRVQFSPPLPADGRCAAGTVVTLTTTPDSGYGGSAPGTSDR